MSSFTFRIVSLPYELQTNDEVAWYVNKTLGLGLVNAVNIVQNSAPNGARFRSATVTVSNCDVSQLRDNLIDSGRNGVMVNSYCYDNDGDTLQFHFDNGKPMLHLKLVFVETRDEPDVSSDNASAPWSSIYIPVLHNDLGFDDNSYDLQTEDGLRQFFETKMCLGTVSRVDFVTKTLSDSNSTVRSAYVHFESWTENPAALHIRRQIDCSGEFVVKGHYEGYNFVRFRNGRFMVLKMNRSPIPEANPEANVHQLAARNAELEAQVADLKAKLAEFEEMTTLLRIKNKAGDAQMDTMVAEMMNLKISE